MMYLSQAHKNNLAVEVLNQLLTFEGFENLLQHIYTFFCKSPKKHAKFTKLIELLESKNNKILCNVKTCWMSIFVPIVRAMNELKPLLIKLYQEAPM
jgi:hypothetical protein